MFGYTFIRTKELQELRRAREVAIRVSDVATHFFGWRDLDLIWSLVFGSYNNGISECRRNYAIERGTDIFGKKIESVPDPRVPGEKRDLKK